jgi:hypothetical protein
MRLSPSFAAAAVLLACAPGAASARPYPNRAAVEAALNAHEACPGGASQSCYPPLRYRLTRARCQSLGPDPINPGRILCIYWGIVRRGRDAAITLRHDCAYFHPARRRGWEVAAYPDADMCE